MKIKIMAILLLATGVILGVIVWGMPWGRVLTDIGEETRDKIAYACSYVDIIGDNACITDDITYYDSEDIAKEYMLKWHKNGYQGTVIQNSKGEKIMK